MANGTEFREGVVHLAEAGHITAEEGEALLRAGKEGGWRRIRVLWDPFGTLPPAGLAGVGALGFLGTVLLARAGFRFDGTLDMHVGFAFTGWKNLALDVAALPALSASLLWLLARLATRGTRYRDLLLGLLVARIPLLLCGAATLLVFRRVGPAILQNLPLLTLVGLVTLPFLLWNLTLLVFALGNASGLRGLRLALAGGGGILMAETATKALLMVIS